ncbi:MAG: response regulator [Cyanothece sp. SIO2G6]|nr:response regulator [Cyanothece sp. SIO2G6]
MTASRCRRAWAWPSSGRIIASTSRTRRSSRSWDQAIDAMICDVEMPRLDGYRLLAKLQADINLRRIPVMMLTSRSGEKHQKLAMGLGAKGYCTKPYNEQMLLQQLVTMTEQQTLAITSQ